MSIRLHNGNAQEAQPTFPMPEAFDVAECLPLSVLELGEPKYKSLLRWTPGVASSVFFFSFWHLAQTILHMKCLWPKLNRTEVIQEFRFP